MPRLLSRPSTAIASLFMLLLAAICSAQQPAATPAGEDSSARIIVEKADQIRFPSDGIQVDVKIETQQANQSSETRRYRVLSKGRDNSVVMILEPAAERGQIMLMKARDLWVFLPDVSQPVRLSLSQRLTGQVANGDLARANFSGDYDSKIIRADNINGENYHVLELTAVDRGVTYAKVLYWVKQSNNAPHKAEFYSISNRLLKTCIYDQYKPMLGEIRPTRLIMEDALRKGERSVLEYSEMKKRDLPDRVFTKEYLRRLE